MRRQYLNNVTFILADLGGEHNGDQYASLIEGPVPPASPWGPIPRKRGPFAMLVGRADYTIAGGLEEAPD